MYLKFIYFCIFKRHFCKSLHMYLWWGWFLIKDCYHSKWIVSILQVFAWPIFYHFLLRNTPVTSGFYNFVSGNNINFEGLPTGIGKLYNLVSCQLWRVLWNSQIIFLLICYFSSWSYCTLPRPYLNSKNTESNNNEVPEINCVQTVC